MTEEGGGTEDADGNGTRPELEEVYGRISDAFFGLDEEWRFTYLNERAHELINPDDRTLTGKNVWDEFPAALTREFKPKYERAMYQQETVTFEEYYPEPLDAWFEVRAYPSETGLSVYFRDVTEKRTRRQALERSEQRYRTLAESFPNGLVTLYDENLEYTLAAGRAFEYLPVSPADVEGKTVREAWGEEAADVLEPALEAAIDGEETEVDLSYVGRDWVVHAVPVADTTGEVFTGMTMAQDITDRKERQRRLRESNERLEQFAYAASHDLREPLRMVSSYLQLIESRHGEDLSTDAEEFLEFAVDGADRMKEMIDGLLEYSRVQTEGSPLVPTDLNIVLDDVLNDLQLRIQETDGDVTVDSLPTVRGDAGQLRQVFQNLVDNALEYSDDPPSVRVDAVREGDMWTIRVADEGIGIDPEHAERVFEVFERLHAHDEHPGTGIGLALCERIVDRHDGTIAIDSTPGEGTTVAVTLPAADGS